MAQGRRAPLRRGLLGGGVTAPSARSSSPGVFVRPQVVRGGLGAPRGVGDLANSISSLVRRESGKGNERRQNLVRDIEVNFPDGVAALHKARTGGNRQFQDELDTLVRSGQVPKEASAIRLRDFEEVFGARMAQDVDRALDEKLREFSVESQPGVDPAEFFVQSLADAEEGVVGESPLQTEFATREFRRHMGVILESRRAQFLDSVSAQREAVVTEGLQNRVSSVVSMGYGVYSQMGEDLDFESVSQSITQTVDSIKAGNPDHKRDAVQGIGDFFRGLVRNADEAEREKLLTFFEEIAERSSVSGEGKPLESDRSKIQVGNTTLTVAEAVADLREELEGVHDTEIAQTIARRDVTRRRFTEQADGIYEGLYRQALELTGADRDEAIRQIPGQVAAELEGTLPDDVEDLVLGRVSRLSEQDQASPDAPSASLLADIQVASARSPLEGNARLEQLWGQLAAEHRPAALKALRTARDEAAQEAYKRPEVDAFRREAAALVRGVAGGDDLLAQLNSSLDQAQLAGFRQLLSTEGALTPEGQDATAQVVLQQLQTTRDRFTAQAQELKTRAREVTQPLTTKLRRGVSLREDEIRGAGLGFEQEESLINFNAQVELQAARSRNQAIQQGQAELFGLLKGLGASDTQILSREYQSEFNRKLAEVYPERSQTQSLEEILAFVRGQVVDDNFRERTGLGEGVTGLQAQRVAESVESLEDEGDAQVRVDALVATLISPGLGLSENGAAVRGILAAAKTGRWLDVTTRTGRSTSRTINRAEALEILHRDNNGDIVQTLNAASAIGISEKQILQGFIEVGANKLKISDLPSPATIRLDMTASQFKALQEDEERYTKLLNSLGLAGDQSKFRDQFATYQASILPE